MNRRSWRTVARVAFTGALLTRVLFASPGPAVLPASPLRAESSLRPATSHLNGLGSLSSLLGEDAARAKAATGKPGPWNDRSSRWWELALAVLGLAFLLWEAIGARRARRAAPEGVSPPSTPRSTRSRSPDLDPPSRRLFALLGLVSALTYFNLGAFHFGVFIHGWDTFHYFVGAKYFRELSYDLLYDCATVADATREADEPMSRYAARNARAAKRWIRNLHTNELETTSALLADRERCTARFTPERWDAFRQDVSWFRGRHTVERWDEVFADHGFNATPVWNIAGSWLANLGPASDRQILLLCLIDPILFAGMVAVLVWAFGIPGTAVGLLVLATDFPARLFWTGGAFLRWDWLFFTVAAVACLRRGRPLLGGAALAYASLLRIFPMFLAVGPIALLVTEFALAARAAEGSPGTRFKRAWMSRALRPHLRFVSGMLLGAALLIPASLAVNGGPEAYRQFLANTQKHQQTPLTNHMGLRTVVSYRPAEIGRRLVSESVVEPWARWKQARLAAWERSRPFAVAIALAVLALVAAAAVRHRELWIGAALGAAFIPFAVELTSYYYAFLIVPALLWTVRREAGIALLALSALGLFISLSPLKGMPTWNDEQYTLISLLTLATLSFVLWRFARPAAGAKGK